MTDSLPWLDLILRQRWAALGTTDDDGTPYVSGIAYCPVAGLRPGLLFHLSQLAAHTGYLQSRPKCSLLIGDPDIGTEDPQTLPRISLSGSVYQISRDSDGFADLAKHYIQKFPASEMRFGLGDFHLFHFSPEKANFVGGFGAAGKISAEKIQAALATIS